MASRVYFNPPIILKATKQAQRRVLVRQGAYVRTTMKGLIRDGVGGKPSAVGRAPRTHNRLLKNSIFWGLTAGAESVIIGPSYHMAGIIGHSHEFGAYEISNQIPRRKNRTSKYQNNWKLYLGGHGPIRIENGEVNFAKLISGAQVGRARRLAHRAAKMDSARKAAKTRAVGRKYPKRPFASKALINAVRRGKIEQFWKDAVGPGNAVGAGAGRLGP
jgi:hypothetical protein